MRRSALFWTFGVVAAGLIAGLASGGFQALETAQARSATPKPAVAQATHDAASESKKAQPAAAPQAAGQNTPESWTSRCSSASRKSVPECFIEQTAVLTKTGQRLATVTVRLPPSGKQPVMMIQVPVGLFLPAGISMQIDDASPIRLVVQTCDLKGCYAGDQISPELLSALKSGKKLAIVFQDLSKRNITVPLTLAQFAEAYQRIQ